MASFLNVDKSQHMMDKRIQVSGSSNDIPDEVQNDLDKIDVIIKNQEERIHSLESKAIQVANLFFVFTGVILTSTSSASKLRCYHWWIPFLLSLIAAFVNVVSAWRIANIFFKSCQELDQNLEDRRVMRAFKITRAQVSQVQPGSAIPPLSRINGEHQIVRTKPDPDRIWRRLALAYTGIGLLAGFSVVMLYSCRAILCHGSNN